MKIKAKFLVVIIVALAAFFVTLAAGTVTTFKTGPFTGIVDLGVPCNNINISKPLQGELLSGASYTDYGLRMCGVVVILRRYDNDTLDLNTNLSASIKIGLSNLKTFTADVDNGSALYVDKHTIVVYNRKIDSKLGAVGSGVVPKANYIAYLAGFYVSPKSFCGICLYNNETEMISVLKTIHVTETV